jgi:RNA polymerase sigma-70 factor (ECF subfamily)
MYFLGGQDAEAEDIVQETFMIALPKLSSYVFNAPIYAWLRQICLRLCYARRRTRNRLVMSPEADLELFLRRAALERTQTESLEALKIRRLELLRRLSGKLKAHSREVFELRNMQEMSYAEIGRSLSIPMGTVMSRLARARVQMRQLVDSQPEPEYAAA